MARTSAVGPHEHPLPTASSGRGTLAPLVVAASGVVGGVLARPPGPPVLVVVLVVLGASALVAGGAGRTWRGWAFVAVVVFALALMLGGRAWSALTAPTPGHLSGRATLTSDPVPLTFGTRVEAVLGDRRVDLVGIEGAAGAIARLRSGDSIEVSGRLVRREDDDLWRASRGVVGVLEVDRATEGRSAGGLPGMANAVHRAVERTVDGLPTPNRGVVLGVALGARAAMPEVLDADLRTAGLSHLTAVSGQHVVILLSLLGPLLGRLRGATRVVALLAVLLGFTVLTRAEPSVLRAVAMAGVVALASLGHRRVGGPQALAYVVVLLVVVDPLIVWSVGFQLSVAATLGIGLWSRGLASRLGGPRWLAEAVAVTCCAQLAVAPLLALHFGSVPIAAIAANIAVVPVIGPLLLVGLVGGTAAGLVPLLVPVVAAPLMWLSGWVVLVATTTSRLPLGSAGPTAVALVVVGTGVVVLAVRRPRFLGRYTPMAGIAGAALFVGVLAWSLVAPVGVPHGRHEMGVGAEVVSGSRFVVLVLDGRSRPGPLISRLREARVRDLDAVVVRTASTSARSTATVLVERFGGRIVDGDVVDGAGRPVGGAVDLGGFWIVTRST